MIPKQQYFVMINEGYSPYVQQGIEDPTIGCYLKSYDPEAHGGRGEAIWTKDKAAAIHFKSKLDAMELWNTVPKAKPLREDGRPNKPLTAFSVTIEAA